MKIRQVALWLTRHTRSPIDFVGSASQALLGTPLFSLPTKSCSRRRRHRIAIRANKTRKDLRLQGHRGSYENDRETFAAGLSLLHLRIGCPGGRLVLSA